MDSLLASLLDPPFAKDPPVKLNIPAKTLGLVYAILGGISAVLGFFGVIALFGLSAITAVAGVGSVFILILIGGVIGEIGTIFTALGGYKMYQGDQGGKKTAIYGLAINVVGGLVSSIGSYGAGIPGWIFGTAITFVLYYLVIICRFEDAPKPA